MAVSKPYALDAVDAAAKALCDHRGTYASANHPRGLTGSAFLWDVADAIGTDQRYIDEREALRDEVRVVAFALAAEMSKGMGFQKDREGTETR